MRIYVVWIFVVVSMICTKIGWGATVVMGIAAIEGSHSVNVEVKE